MLVQSKYKNEIILGLLHEYEFSVNDYIGPDDCCYQLEVSSKLFIQNVGICYSITRKS